MSEDQEKYGKDAPERFADSREEDAWNAYACAALRLICDEYRSFRPSLAALTAGNFADAMMTEWRRRARPR